MRMSISEAKREEGGLVRFDTRLTDWAAAFNIVWMRLHNIWIGIPC